MFGAAIFKEGIGRVVNNHQDFAPSRESESSGAREDANFSGNRSLLFDLNYREFLGGCSFVDSPLMRCISLSKSET